MSLIFGEIIEINICGLSDNTKRNISYRAQAEEDIIRTDNNFDDMNEEQERDIDITKDFKSLGPEKDE